MNAPRHTYHQSGPLGPRIEIMNTTTKDTSQPARRPEREYLVVYGPPGSGKTLNAATMCAALGYDHAFDADFQKAEILQAKGRIILFSHEERVRDPDDTVRPYRHVMRKKPIEGVRRFLGARWVEPSRNVIISDASSKSTNLKP